jgi:hypothetical protein
MPFASEFEELAEQTFSGDNVARGPLIVSDFSRTLLPLLTEEEWQDALGVSGGGGGSIEVPNTLFVSTEGNNATAEAGNPAKPYLTIAAAVTAQTPSDTIFIEYGIYNNVGNIVKDQSFSILSATRASNITTIATDEAHGLSVGNRVFHWFEIANQNAPGTFDGEFTVLAVTDANTYTVSNRGSNGSGGAGVGSGLQSIYCAAGAVLNGTSGASIVDFFSGVYSGFHFIDIAGFGSFVSNAYAVVSGGTADVITWTGLLAKSVSPASANSCIALSGAYKAALSFSDRVEATGYDALLGCQPWAYGSFSISSPLIIGGTDTQASAASSANGTELEAGVESITTVSADRLVSVSTHAIQIAPSSSNNGRIIIEAKSIEGGAAAIHTQAGATGSNTYRIRCVETKQGTHGIHMEDDGSVIDFSGRISTAANASANPVVKAGGTLILQSNTVLIAEGTRDSIEASSAQTVYGCGFTANKAVDSTNITVSGEYTVNTDLT